MNLQKINVKMFTDSGERIRLEPFLDVFARWREDHSHAAAWIDLADYAHVPQGPGVMLIGRRGNLAFDLADPGPGILYANKQDLSGGPAERIRETFRRGLALITALTGEPDYPAELKPRPGFWEVTFNDRLEAPHSAATDGVLAPAVREVAGQLFGTDGSRLIPQPDPGRRYGFAIHSEAAGSLEWVADRLERAIR